MGAQERMLDAFHVSQESLVGEKCQRAVKVGMACGGGMSYCPLSQAVYQSGFLESI